MGDAQHEDPWEVLRALPMGQRVEVIDESGRVWTGTIVPRHEFSGDRILQVKLASGYNVGVRVGVDSEYRLIEGARSDLGTTGASPAVGPARSGPWVALLTTGGTIASRVDYETGGVRPVTGERETLDFYPELEEGGAVRIIPVFDRLSEDLVPNDWVVLAKNVVDAFRDGARGVVVAHGTDTLGFTSAGLSFLLADLPGPVVLVGAQRSPDRPSSDGAPNLRAAVSVARDATIGEVVVVMHSGLSDDRFAIHRGSSVRKMHSTRRDAFRSRNEPPLGFVESGTVRLEQPVRPPGHGPATVDGPLDLRGGLLWFYPGLTPESAAEFARPLRGVVLAGTGLGHVGSIHVEWIRAAVARGVVVAMTTQCLEGEVDPYVYSTGRELLRAGVVYLGDLLPETAYAKLLWALGRASRREDVERLLTTDHAGEFHPRRSPKGAA